jgi:glutamate/tyrosine decarboxylase-like PLP-dependent enzyme
LAEGAAARLLELIRIGIDGIDQWEAGYGHVDRHESLNVSADRSAQVLDNLVERLHDNYPFFHPRYAGQMLKPPHPVAVAAYATAMQINPNAHALDGGPATARLEREAVTSLASMFGFPQHLGHLTSSGTIANLEALFVARSLHPGAGIAFSAEAHYTHARMCQLLKMDGFAVASDARGRMDLAELATLLATGRVGTVVATAGTTGLGAVDQVQDIVRLAREYGARVHVDSAYGGFFTLLARSAAPAVEPEPWLAIAGADSVVVDPHKHGLQPYGCGAVVFRDPSVGRFYDHDSPYTYFTSAELHLGEISLECSRAGAAAAAFWATLQVFPLAAEIGFGPILRACRRAALRWDELVSTSAELAMYQRAELDIVTYFDRQAASTSQVSASSERVLHAGMTDPDPVFVSTLSVSSADFARRHPDIAVDSERVAILRSVLMKPEHEAAVPWLAFRLADLMAKGK